MTVPKRLIVGISGASGVIYGVRLLEKRLGRSPSVGWLAFTWAMRRPFSGAFEGFFLTMQRIIMSPAAERIPGPRWPNHQPQGAPRCRNLADVLVPGLRHRRGAVERLVPDSWA